MGDHDHGHAVAVELVQKRQQFAGGRLVEGAGRLVGQQQFRTVDQGPQHGHPLPLAPRKLPGEMLHPGSQARPFKQAFGPGNDVLPVLFRGDGGKNHILQRRALRQQMMALKHQTDLPQAEQ